LTTIKNENKLKTKNRNNTLTNKTKQVSPDIPFSQELLRKGVHLISISIPIGYYYATKELAFIILIPVTLFFLIIDILGQKNSNPKIITYIFRKNAASP